MGNIQIEHLYDILRKDMFTYKTLYKIISWALSSFTTELKELKKWQPALLLTSYAMILHICYMHPLKIILFSFSFYYFLKLLNALPRTIKVISIFYLSLVLTMQITLAIQFHTDSNLYIMSSIFETNTREAYELLSEAGIKPFLVLALIFLVQLVLSRKLLASVKLSLLILSSTILLLLIWPINKVITINVETDYNVLYAEINRSLNTFPLFTLPISYMDNIRERNLLKSLDNKNKNNPAYIVGDKKIENQIQKIILVIGESSARSHYGIYGYNYNTTPNMGALMENANAFHKEVDAISPANITRTSLIQVLSFGHPKNLQPFFNEKNIVEMAEAMDYGTVWISNQAKTGIHDTYVGAIANSANLTYFNPDKWLEVKPSLDISLIPILKEKNCALCKQFIVVHLIGSHLKYESKYGSVDFSAMETSPEKFRAYDSSIHHTDRLLNEVQKLMRNEKSVITIYVSDHGENVNSGHGSNELNRVEYEVPYFWFGDDKSVREFTAINNKYKSRKHEGVINISSLPYVLSEVMGWEVNDAAINRIVSDREFVLNVDGSVASIGDLH